VHTHIHIHTQGVVRCLKTKGCFTLVSDNESMHVYMYTCIYIYIYTHTHTHTQGVVRCLKTKGHFTLVSDNESICKSASQLLSKRSDVQNKCPGSKLYIEGVSMCVCLCAFVCVCVCKLHDVQNMCPGSKLHIEGVSTFVCLFVFVCVFASATTYKARALAPNCIHLMCVCVCMCVC
jgi:hypothetical protein